MSDWGKNKELFERELRKGHAFQLKVADALMQMGYAAEVPELFVSKKDGFDYSFAQSEDVVVGRHVIEVKSRNLKFSGPENFPFQTIFVDTVEGYDLKDKKPALYVVISQLTGDMIAIETARTFEYWTKSRVYDRVRGVYISVYECPREYWEGLEPAMGRLAGLVGLSD